MIEYANGRPDLNGHPTSRFGELGAEAMRRKLTEADTASVVSEARRTLAVRSLASGVPVADLARHSDAVNMDDAEWRDYVAASDAEFNASAARCAVLSERIDAVLNGAQS